LKLLFELVVVVMGPVVVLVVVLVENSSAVVIISNVNSEVSQPSQLLSPHFKQPLDATIGLNVQ
jgi:hypothetical protein